MTWERIFKAHLARAPGAPWPSYAQAALSLSAEYRAVIPPELAVRDALRLERLIREGGEGFDLWEPQPVLGDACHRLRLYGERERCLDEVMPLLQNLGLRVMDQVSFRLEAGPKRLFLRGFAVTPATADAGDPMARKDDLLEALQALLAGWVENDALNGLLLPAGLSWREIDAFRAYRNYYFQLGSHFGRFRFHRALLANPAVAALLFRYFAARFEPDGRWSGPVQREEEALSPVRQELAAALDAVADSGEDRILRDLFNLIDATLRTDFYSPKPPPAHAIALKINSLGVINMPAPRPLFEIYVHSRLMEGIHLRGAKVARGGIRWSDRPDDFRSEILDLMLTQMIKNALIVPLGAKGGFVLNSAEQRPEERDRQAKQAYATLIRGLLNLTDNPGVATERVAYDDADPYLVVAADKGTSRLSDSANGIAAEYGFWLGDAFASGGSRGYHHKGLGITARGAWECVKRHFMEKGKDIQAEPFTVAGIGDMSGDVFGNGMLLSRQIRLIAAFDHRHVFIDPDPDPAPTYAERERMFKLGRSSWADYDTRLLSAGGAIVPRGAKEVELSPQARAALGLREDAPAVMDGESLIRAVLRAPVELLWNGGIGTYVKSPSESHADAGDPSNDAVRVNSDELRCEVVGEGGNLGFTQRARIEFGLAGGRVNTDAMDNSGGVDMSDHEVNLKILLAPAVSAGRMTQEGRNGLLEELTEQVADLVLEDNRTQSLGISLDEMRVRESPDRFRDLMIALEKAGELNRESEGLPSTDVMLERAERGPALSRPELCVLLAYAKLSLKAQLLRGTLVDDPSNEDYLRGYFPARSVAAAGDDALRSHRLRREIIAGQISNALVDLMGATFVSHLVRETGRSAEEVARAWLVASRLSGHRAVLVQLAEQHGARSASVSYRWILGMSRVLQRTTRWVLRSADPDSSPGKIVQDYAEGLNRLRAGFRSLVRGEDRALFERLVEEIRALGADDAFSERLITLRFLDQILEILQIAEATGSEATRAGAAYYELAETLSVPWLRETASSAVGGGAWGQRASQALAEDLSRAHRRLVTAALAKGSAADLLASAPREVERYLATLGELRSEGSPGLAGASVAVRELAALAERLQA